jgi:hypothetical protein
MCVHVELELAVAALRWWKAWTRRWRSQGVFSCSYFCSSLNLNLPLCSTEVAEGVDTALALTELVTKMDKSYRIDLKYAIVFGVADILKVRL